MGDEELSLREATLLYMLAGSGRTQPLARGPPEMFLLEAP